MASIDMLVCGFALTCDQGGFGFSTLSLITAGKQRILVDTGPHSRRAMLVRALKERNLTPEQIDLVVLTHAHWDHCQNTDIFRNAQVLIHPVELEYARNPQRGDMAVATYLPAILERMKVETVSEGDEVAEGVSIIDTPGHSKGHLSVLVNVSGQTRLVAGDALPDAASVRRGLPYNVFWDLKDARESVAKMVASAQMFYPGHDRPFSVEGDHIHYHEGPTQITVTNSLEAGEGVTALNYEVLAHREPVVNLVQKG
ncbi:MAG: N-acyl homoserine lactonase family protein [Chloroflexi bacterium]|nr:N-acyl homoserine lactonase family protein [Chloroflexota bacterium]